MSNDPLGKIRTDAALENAGLQGGEVTSTTTGYLGGRAVTVVRSTAKKDTAVPALRAVVRGAMTVLGVPATAVAAAATLPAMAHPSARKTLLSAGKKAWSFVNNFTEKGDAAALGRLAKQVAITATVFGAIHTIGTKEGRQKWIAESGEIIRNATFSERQQAEAARQKRIAQNGYDERDAHDVARFLNEKLEKGQAFRENGCILYCDNKRGAFLVARESADGRAIPDSARSMTVRTRSFSKPELVKGDELARYARTYAKIIDDIAEKMKEKPLSGEALETATNGYLQALSRKKEDVKLAKLLVEFYTPQGLGNRGDSTPEQKWTEIKRYLNKIPLSLNSKNSLHTDRKLEIQLMQKTDMNGLTTDERDYLNRYRLDDTNIDKLKEHLKKQEFVYAQLKDHLQCQVMDLTGIQYTQVGKTGDTQGRSVMAALDEKLAAYARDLYPNGTADLKSLIAGLNWLKNRERPADESLKAYGKNEDLLTPQGEIDQAKLEEHLNKIAKRYGVKRSGLEAKLRLEINDAEMIYKNSMERNLQAQKLLLDARSPEGVNLSDADRAILIEYLKREGIIAKASTVDVRDFKNSPEINQAKMSSHIEMLANRYGMGQRAYSLLMIHRQFVGHANEVGRFSTKELNALAEDAGRDPTFRAFLKSENILAKESGGKVERKDLSEKNITKLYDHIISKYGNNLLPQNIIEAIDAKIADEFPQLKDEQNYLKLIAEREFITHSQTSQALATAANRDPLLRAFLKEKNVIDQRVTGEIIPADIQAHDAVRQTIASMYNRQENPALLEAINAELANRFSHFLHPEQAAQLQEAALLQKVSTLMETTFEEQRQRDPNFDVTKLEGMMLRSREASEKSQRIRMIQDLWLLTSGRIDSGNFSNARLTRLSLFLRAEGADVPNQDWTKFNWKEATADEAEGEMRESIHSVVNTCLENELGVVNTGEKGGEEIQKEFNNRLSDNDAIAAGEVRYY